MYYWLFYEVEWVLRTLGCVVIFFESCLLVITAVILGADWIRVDMEICTCYKGKFLDTTIVLEMLLFSEKTPNKAQSFHKVVNKNKQ